MEDLLINFIEHIGKNVSNQLGNELKIYIEEMMENHSNSNAFDNDNYEEIEHGLKRIISNYFKNCRSENFLEISQNLFNEYIEYDDSNITRAVKYFIRVYSKFEEIKLKKLFCRWRINILYVRNISVNENKKEKVNSNLSKENNIISIQEKKISSNENYAKHYINANKFVKLNDQMKNSKNNTQFNQNDIFNKLYMDSFKKQDERLLKDEMKKISEMEECTFRPKISKN